MVARSFVGALALSGCELNDVFKVLLTCPPPLAPHFDAAVVCVALDERATPSREQLGRGPQALPDLSVCTRLSSANQNEQN